MSLKQYFSTHLNIHTYVVNLLYSVIIWKLLACRTAACVRHFRLDGRTIWEKLSHSRTVVFITAQLRCVQYVF
jgi:hypothetical protein